MKKNTAKRCQSFIVLAAFVMSIVSCSGDDYLNVVPSNSIAVMSVDLTETAAQSKGGTEQLSLIKSLFKTNDIGDCGINVTSKLYLFESAEGNLGLVAKVSDDDELDSWLNKLAESGYCTKTSKRGGCRFSTVKGCWVAGFNSTAVVIMGPVIAAQQPIVQQQIIRYINQDEDDGLKSSPLFDRLDSIDAPIALVTQAAALPDKFTAPFTLGAPKDTEASQIFIAAGINISKSGCVEIAGTPFSLNKSIDKSLEESLKTLRPITGKYLATMSKGDAMGAFMNVDGRKFIDLLHSNQSFQALLAGINTAIDMDNIIKSVDGDMAIIMPRYTENNTSLRMSAKLGSKNFLADVDYWKKSCPKGGRIDNMGKDTYCYKDGSMNYIFGVSNDMQYFSGSTTEQAAQSIGKASDPLPQAVRTLIEGKRFCMVMNITSLLSGNEDAKALTPLLKPLLGDINTIIYSVK